MGYAGFSANAFSWTLSLLEHPQRVKQKDRQPGAAESAKSSMK
jgi:hypothetical protein